MPNKKTTRISAGLITLVLLGVLIWFLFPSVTSWLQPSDAEAKPPAQTAKVTIAKPLVMPIIEWDEFIGRMEAVESVEVQARVGGHLEALYIKEGDSVEVGDPLFLIDPRPYEAVLAEAKAALNEAKSAVVEAKAFETQSVAQRDQVAARLELATTQLVRFRRLIKQKAIAQDEYDTQESEKDQAIADLAAANAAIESAKARSVSASAAVESAAATVMTAELNLSFTQVNAPISGRVSRAYATKGNLISGGTEGATLLTTIVSTNPIHCYFDANEREVLKYIRLDRSGARKNARRVKIPVFMSVVDEDGYPHEGYMDFVDNQIDSNTGTIRGRAIFDNEDKVFLPGMFAKVRLPGSERYDATLIPDSAVGVDQTEQFVVVVNKDNTTQRQQVELGPIVHGLRVVRSGIEGNENIVIQGLQRIRPGITVDPSEGKIVATVSEDLPDKYKSVPKESSSTPELAPDGSDDFQAVKRVDQG
ncbi:efflux RND transporter periplasmic adaptor subunit [Mariniblastus sp.]|nr:efflux RND transporter periplasmic adaptor subunit [Mariniblastus sp.]